MITKTVQISATDRGETNSMKPDTEAVKQSGRNAAEKVGGCVGGCVGGVVVKLYLLKSTQYGQEGR